MPGDETTDAGFDRMNYTPEVNGRALFYGRDGEPITLGQWSEMFSDTEGRTVAQDSVGPYRIVTMWLGMDDDAVVYDETPKIFGTAVLAGTAGQMLGEFGSATEVEAHAMHQATVEMVKSWPESS